MPLTTASPVKQAIVAALRANTALTTEVPPPADGAHKAITGIYEGFAPSSKPYPFLVYNLVYASYDFLWEPGATVRMSFDVSVWAENSVEANNLDSLIIATLHDATLSVAGQSMLLCRRRADLSSVDVDDQGTRVYQMGGTYDIWTDQN